MNKPLFPEIRVNGTTIAQSAIAAEAQNHKAPAGKPGVAWQSAARALVVRHLLLEDASKKGLTFEPALLAEDMMEADDEAIIRGYLEENLIPEDVQEEEITQVVEKRGANVETNEDSRKSIRQVLEQRNWAKAANEVVTGLVTKADIIGIEMVKA